ncbi:MAG: hypothetical protein AB1405_14500 [Bdellovibrionota bacterium]
MRTQRVWLVLLLATLFLPANLLAQSGKAFNPRTPRALGMGNAAVGVGGDYNALFYNPAGLATIEEMEIQALAPMWESNKETLGFIGDVADVSTANDAAQLIINHQGEPIFSRIDSISYFTIKKGPVAIGAAVVFDWTLEQSISSADSNIATPTDEIVITRKTTDLGGVVGLSYDVIEKYVAAGLNLKLFNRWSSFDTENAQELAGNEGLDAEIVKPFGGCGGVPILNCQSDSSFGAGVDLGTLFMVPFEEIPALGNAPGLKGSRLQAAVVWQDVADTRFDFDDIPQTVDIGLAYIQSIVIGDVKLAVDFRDLNRDTNGLDPDYTFGEKVSFGGEIAFKKILTLRAGLNETGGAAGLALRLWVWRLEGGWFQEKTELPSSGRDNRFFISSGFGWYN